MSGRHAGNGRSRPSSGLDPQGRVASDVLLTWTTPRPLPRNHGTTLEDLATPDAPGLLPVQCGRQALDPQTATDLVDHVLLPAAKPTR